jgi:hypothetical protein
MTKNTVLRNDSPHAVKMLAGSNVAEHKSRKVAAPKEPAEKPKPKPATKVSVPPPAETQVAPVKPAKRAPAKPRAKVRLKTTQAAPSNEAVKPLPELPPTPLAPVPPVLDEADLWEQDSPVKNRLAQLRTRNSLLDEQIRKLKTPFQARGKKP